ncbi:MDR family MFS transporter [Longirhabdus pacifica]|uniref:MDR family MFS transporter n=1 Tax=Longirhabdus pacifica TaxID=2305227 RepID=UPI001008E0D7|nr:MFS transporter [Longirhabdus pacifica]
MKNVWNELKNYNPIVNFLLFGTMLSRIGSSMSLPFLAIYMTKVTPLNPTSILFAVSLSALASTFGGFLGGHLADKIGRKQVIIFSLFVWSITFFCFAVATHIWMFIILNILNGLCRSFYEPASQAMMTDLSKPSQRARIFTLRYLTINIGATIGPMLGALFAMVNILIPWLLTGAIYFLYTIIMAIKLKDINESTYDAKKETVSFKHSILTISKDLPLLFFIIGGILIGTSFSQMSTGLSLHLTQNFNDGFSMFNLFINQEKMYTILLVVNTITIIVLQLKLSSITEKINPMRIIIIGSVLFAIGNVGLGLSFTSGWFILSMIVYTLGEMLIFPASSVFVDQIAPEGMKGTYFGSYQFISLGFFLGPLMGGIVLDHLNGTVLFLMMAVISLAATFFYYIGNKKYRPLPSSSESV